MKKLIILMMSFLPFTLSMANEIECHYSPDTLLNPQVEELQISLANVSWTQNEKYEGQVIVFTAKVHTNLKEAPGVDAQGYKTQYYLGSFQTEAQLSDNGVEHLYLKVQPVSIQKVRELEKDGRFHIINKTVDLGNVQVSRDVPLAQSHYIELEPIRIHGAIGWSPSDDSHWEFIMRASASVGYALAHSTKDFVPDTNNFYVGHEFGWSLKHERLGTVAFDRGVDGEMTKYDPNSTNSREAFVKASYTFEFKNNSSLSITGEKRSFRFGPEYEKSRRYFITYSKKFK